MALSVFESRDHAPTPAALRTALGRAATHWDALVSSIDLTHGPVERVWSYAGAKFGWSMRLVRGGRVIVYLTPQAGQFLAGFALGGKAESAARAAGLPAAVLALLDAAPKYAEGRGLRVPVRTRTDVAAVRKLAAAKMGGQS